MVHWLVESTDNGLPVPQSAAVRRWRIGLVITGVALLLTGGVILLTQNMPQTWIGIAVWLIGAIVLHDGVIAMTVLGASIVFRRIGRRIPLVAILVVQAALVVGGIMTLLVLPEIVKKSIGTANPTILPLPYAGNLLWFYVGLFAVTVVALVIVLGVRKLRGSAQTS